MGGTLASNMAATRIISGQLREIWQELVPQGGGGPPQVITTGIHARNPHRSRVRGTLTVTSIVGVPVVSAVLNIVDDFFVIQVFNTAGGTSFTWMLDIERTQSTQQAIDPTYPNGVIQVVSGVLSTGGLAAPQTLAQTYDIGTVDADQRMIVSTAKGGGVTIDCTDAAVTADGVSLEIRQSAAWLMPMVIGRRADDNQGAILQFSRARGTYPVPADLQDGDAIGSIHFLNQYLGVGQFGTLINASVVGVAGGPATAYDFYAAYANVSMNMWRMDRPGVNLARLTGFGINPGIIPNTTHTGYLGEGDKIWASAAIDTVSVYDNIIFNGASAGANANHTIAFPAAATVEPTATAGLVHVYAWLFAGGGAGSNLAALTITAAEPVLAAQAFADYQVGIPCRYNGKDYYLLARDMSPA
jgi:hypothetical protein